MGSRLAPHPNQRAAVERLRAAFLDVTARIEHAVRTLLKRVAGATQGLVLTEAQADDLLGRLVDRLVGTTAPTVEATAEPDELPGAAVLLLVQQVVAEARERFVRRVVRAKRN